MNRRLAALAAALVLTGGRAGSFQDDPGPRLAATVEPVISALWTIYDTGAAMDHVRFMSQYWRLPGNPGYNASIDRIRDRLIKSGLEATVEEYPSSGPAWDYSVGTVALVRPGQADEVVLSREQDGPALCINSFSTPAEGVVAPLVDVGRGDRDEDYAGKDVKGAVVLGTAEPAGLWRRAVVARGAVGVISSALAPYVTEDPPGAPPTPREKMRILQWGSVPYDEKLEAFGFKASPWAATRLAARLADKASGPALVRVTAKSAFTTGPVRTLVVEIPGTSAPQERIVMAAHVQEPGANDNASGVATLAEMAAAFARGIAQKKIPPPARTLTFLFLTEISGSRRWLQDHAAEAKQVKYMFSLDMTGEDVRKTGGSFLVERYPDPGAVWDRPWDPHSEWGRGNVRAESLKGDLINDAHLFVAREVAKRSRWIVKTNPYEGGSDHTVFGQAGIPSVLDWHFTDRFYHTNLDTPDKVSPEEMRNVGVAVGATAWLFASADEKIALDVAGVVVAAGRERLALEGREGAKLAESGADRAAARTRDATIVAAWRKWYGEAVRSAVRLVVGAVSPAFDARVVRLAAAFENTPGAGGLARSAFLPLVLVNPPAPARPAPDQAPQIARSLERVADKFTCGDDAKVPVPIPVRWSTVVLMADGRLYVPCNEPGEQHTPEHREMAENALLSTVLGTMLNPGRSSTTRILDLEVRWRAVQALARLGLGLGEVRRTAQFVPACNAEVQIFGGLVDPVRWQPGQLFRLVQNPDVRVRQEAAYAIGLALSKEGIDPTVATGARRDIEVCLLTEKDPTVTALLLEAIGVARYGNDDARRAAETFLVARSQRPALVEVLGAVKGLEALIRQSPGFPVSDTTRVRLRDLALHEPPGTAPGQAEQAARVRRLAMMALQAARDDDVYTLDRAADDRDWQVRRLVASGLNLADPQKARIGERLRQDPALQVRYDYLSALSRQVTQTRLCAPLVTYFDDLEPTVVMRAFDLVSARCTDLDDAVAALARRADDLAKPESHERWHIPSRALTALARVRPAEATKRLLAASTHQVWQVRAAAAVSFVQAGMMAEAIQLASDPVANVRTAAIDALVRAKDAGVLEPALEALRYGSDFQLLRAAAGALNDLPDDRRDEATEVLLGAMRRLTELGEDFSRDPRIAILGALQRVMRPERATDLLAFTTDVDDVVNGAASKAFAALVGGAPPESRNPSRRYPYQPDEGALAKLPIEADIKLREGTVTIAFRPDVAPVTIARFAALASAGYYNGLTFHRIAPNFVVQGGSPGANEYVGTARYMRDEVGLPHLRGAVGISTRGRDTGDAQIFIDLVDVPRLDYTYTVFGYVTVGMEHVDRMLEGAVIQSVTLRYR